MKVYEADDWLLPGENVHVVAQEVDGGESEHTHGFLELVYIRSGSGIQSVQGVDFPVARGDALFIPMGQTHAFHAEGPMSYVNCLMSPDFIGRDLLDADNVQDWLTLGVYEDPEWGRSRVSFRGAAMLEIESLLDNMLAEFTDKAEGYRTILKGSVAILVTRIFRRMRQEAADKPEGHGGIPPEVLRYIEENCFGRISLEELARKSFYHPAYFSRLFKSFYGRTLTAFIHERRMTEAMRLLCETTGTVEEIAEHVGYHDRKQFHKLFRETAGTTPSLYRARMKQV